MEELNQMHWTTLKLMELKELTKKEKGDLARSLAVITKVKKLWQMETQAQV